MNNENVGSKICWLLAFLYDVIQRLQTVRDVYALTTYLVLGVINALKCNRASEVIATLRKTASFASFRKLAHATEVVCYILNSIQSYSSGAYFSSLQTSCDMICLLQEANSIA